MKLKDIFEAEGGGYPSKGPKDKTKHVSRMLRRKSDRSNPDSRETELNPEGTVDKAKEVSS